MKTILSEGRKFGVAVGLISQRPGKLDADVLSQCMTQFILRIVNPVDQARVAESVESVGRDLLQELPALSKGHHPIPHIEESGQGSHVILPGILPGNQEGRGQREGQEKEEEGRKEPERSSHVESTESDSTLGGPFLQEERCDEKAAQDEEHIDSDVSPGKAPPEVEGDHQEDRQTSQPVQSRAVPQRRCR